MRIGQPFAILNEVDSTNNYAIRMVQAQMADHGHCWFAHKQTAGKGQRSRHWQSANGENIIMTCSIHPAPLRPSEQFILTAAVALGCYDFFNSLTNGDTAIKWPNDIYWRDRKAGGILIESIVRGKTWKYAVAGIGININQVDFPPNVPNAVSLRQITGKLHNPVEMSKTLCEFLETRWQQIVAGERESVISEYNARLYKKERQVSFSIENATFAAVVKGVNATGDLLLDTGEISSYKHGTLEWMG